MQNQRRARPEFIEIAEWYPKDLGTLLTNLHVLEYAIRGRLSYEDPAVDGELAANMQVSQVQVGDVVRANSLTSYESLGELIARYNRTLAAIDDVRVDPTVVSLRDVLAHGRLLPLERESSLRLIKFGRSDGAQTVVEFAQTLSHAWFREQITRLEAEVDKVLESMRRARERMV